MTESAGPLVAAGDAVGTGDGVIVGRDVGIAVGRDVGVVVGRGDGVIVARGVGLVEGFGVGPGGTKLPFDDWPEGDPPPPHAGIAARAVKTARKRRLERSKKTPVTKVSLPVRLAAPLVLPGGKSFGRGGGDSGGRQNRFANQLLDDRVLSEATAKRSRNVVSRPAFDRRVRMLAQRSWTPRERRIVWRGLTGRFAIAIEPLIGIAFMIFITVGIVWRAHHVPADATLIKIAPIFAVGALAFLGYFIAVLAAPVAAYAQTFKPIYIVDGYVRYRKPDFRSEIDSAGYVATLFEDRSVACEWVSLGSKPLPDVVLPALVEFSVYAGIHSIDGKSTGLVPDGELPALAIGIAPRRGTAGYNRDDRT